MRSDLGTVSGLRRRCVAYRAHIGEHGLATDQEIRDHWPGGAENSEPGLGGWVYCYGSYRAFLLRGERHAEEPTPDEAGQEVALEAMREKALPVDFPAGWDGPDLTAHPKSYDTLTLIDEIDYNILCLLAGAEALKGKDGAETPLRYGDLLREISTLHQTIAWIACTEGPGAPFPPAGPLPDEIPAPFRDLDPVAIVSVLKTFHQVNRDRLQIISGILHRLPSSGQPASWATLAVHAAKQFGQPVEHLLRNRSLASWLGQLAVLSVAEYEAAQRRPER